MRTPTPCVLLGCGQWVVALNALQDKRNICLELWSTTTFFGAIYVTSLHLEQEFFVV